MFKAGLLDVLNENLPRFDSLKTFRILASTLNELDLGRTCYEDFKLLQKWAQLCPTLSRCDIPSCQCSDFSSLLSSDIDSSF